MIKSSLAMGPMSRECIEAIFLHSHFYRKQLMIIASKNQIDYNNGYVMKTQDFMELVKQMRENYPNADVLICRDHCGPMFNGNPDLGDVYKTIEADIRTGFDLIHIDFCHHQPKEEQFEKTRRTIEYCKKLNPNIMIEVGTDENVGTNFGVMNLKEVEREIDFFVEFKPEFYVVQTGSLVKEINQVGNFNKDFVKKVSGILKLKGIKLKEHNADYLSREQIQERKGIVDAQNIAPQLGVVQTMITLKYCLIYGIDFSDFLEEVYNGRRWKKWLYGHGSEDKFLCCIIAGHYHFSSESYKKIIEQLGKKINIKEKIINEVIGVINHYT
jgi:hypothetical protein